MYFQMTLTTFMSDNYIDCWWLYFYSKCISMVLYESGWFNTIWINQREIKFYQKAFTLFQLLATTLIKLIN